MKHSRFSHGTQDVGSKMLVKQMVRNKCGNTTAGCRRAGAWQKGSHFCQPESDILSKLGYVLLRIMSCDWFILI